MNQVRWLDQGVLVQHFESFVIFNDFNFQIFQSLFMIFTNLSINLSKFSEKLELKTQVFSI